jgi:glycosyltransferase involved in cell wall biosynthesis
VVEVAPSGGTATFVSYRLGGTDGVSVEAAKWMRALESLGFAPRRIAGDVIGAHDAGRSADLVVPWLALTPPAATAPPDPAALTRELDAGDVTIVENVCSLPLNLPAARAVADAVSHTRSRVVFHHHDLPWQRPQTADVTDLPPTPPDALHVTINSRSRDELATRGIAAVEITNAFDVDAVPGRRDETRRQLGFAPDEVVVLQPARAIPRKNVPAALQFAEALDPLVRARRVVFWLTGPAEDDYQAELDRLLGGAGVRIRLGLGPTPADAYAAADVVVFPSTVEGFGNPVIESVIARRPLAVGHYPVLDEILAHGFELFTVEKPGAVADWLARPDVDLLDRNVARARARYSLAGLPDRIDSAFRTHGWTAW